METIKKFSKEISVFGLVLVVFLCLFAYRQATYKTYTTISQDKVSDKITAKDSFILVAGPSTDNSVVSYQEVLTKYATKNRSTTIYYCDMKASKVSKILKEDVTLPCTFIIKDGKVTSKKSGALNYYALNDFISENS